MSAGERVAAAARALVGVRFRPQGRSAETGLDCIGVAMLAWDLRAHAARDDYNLRTRGFKMLERELTTIAAAIAPEAAGVGDLLVVDAGGGQPHMLILTPGGFVHAEARTRRVVEVPGAETFPIRSAWRRRGDHGNDKQGRDGWRRSF